MLGGSGTRGLVTLLSRTARVSRQTLYAWAEQGRAALEQAFQWRDPERTITPEVERQVLSVLVETHASVRGIQRLLWQVLRQRVSVGTISAIIGEAQRRAQTWMSSHAPASSRPLALDEMYGNDRRGAYLHIVGTASHAVWAAEGPVPVDIESWHSILRPHLAVHRVLSPGLLALLVVWHNHRAFARGPQAGSSPLHLSGMTDAPPDWLVALGYPPLDTATPAPTLASTRRQVLPIAA